jgi:hypothetical protein
VPSDSREEVDPISVPETKEKELANGRVLVKPDYKFQKQGNKQVFAKGTTGNGRPKGSKNRMTLLAAEMIGEKADKIIAKIINKALNDDDKDQAMMLKLLIERIAPATKSIDVTAINRDEKTITISVEGVTVHEKTIGEELNAEIVEFIEEDKNGD